ncbi:MAG: cytochrome C biogenesis protein [Alphaproteobacteria bacterium]|nr:MAG: cytochrome C biogenesis protein [Alphaproteobacteria bacterium]
MTPGFERLRRSAAACAVVTAICVTNASAAEDASAWNGDSRSAIRLIAGSWSGEQAAPLRAGVEMRLKPGWHTYWRYPGDAGVPPRFDFSGSRNLKALHMLWPAPRRIREHGLSVIGYTKDLILPLIIVPQDRAAPVTLHLAIDYAVCELLCLPQQAMTELVLAQTRSSRDAALAEAQARVPRKQALGDGSTFAVRAIRREESSARSRAVIDLQAPPGASVDLFAEGPSADWALPLPTLQGEPSTPGLQRFAFDLDGAPPGAKYEGVHITITAVTAEDAIEVTAPLD